MGYPTVIIAQLAFFVFAIVIYGRHERALATAVTVLAGMMFLPDTELVTLGGVVEITKDRVIYLAAALAILVHQGEAFRQARPVASLTAILLPMLLINIAGWQTNLAPVVNESSIQQGLSMAWVVGQTIDDFFVFGLPFVIGKAMIKSAADLRVMMYVLVGMGLIYTGLILIELVMAIPFLVFQFSDYIYGLPGKTQFRYGLTEPTVFMARGHTLSSFMLMTVIAAAAFRQFTTPPAWMGVKRAHALTLVGLVATLKAASNLWGFAVSALFAIFQPARIAFFGATIAFLICLYPLTQILDVFPEQILVDLAQDFDEERARSFAGRFNEEDFVMERSEGRLLFGWGHFGRIPDASLAGYETGDPGLDAWWVIKLGMSGIVGVEWALLICAVPILRARKYFKTVDSEETQWLLCALMMCIGVRMADLLLNGFWNSLPIFLAGTLYAVCIALRKNSQETLNQKHAAERRALAQ